MKIYTKTGDSGTTGLFGAGRVSKSHPRVEAYGTVDELNAAVGVARSALDGLPELSRLLATVQEDLFVIGADLATPLEARSSVPRVSKKQVEEVEAAIDEAEEDLEPLEAFVLPAGARSASALHLARTICRRAERRVVQLAETENINEIVTVYLNRLADLLFVLARVANAREGPGDTLWSGRRREEP